ncbi:hypothetical protein Mapa_000241 [Marchantia paleacea]|nr:hypothetical protein Mapa_000241 [Marchantia paleacea]
MKVLHLVASAVAQQRVTVERLRLQMLALATAAFPLRLAHALPLRLLLPPHMRLHLMQRLHVLLPSYFYEVGIRLKPHMSVYVSRSPPSYPRRPALGWAGLVRAELNQMAVERAS